MVHGTLMVDPVDLKKKKTSNSTFCTQLTTWYIPNYIYIYITSDLKMVDTTSPSGLSETMLDIVDIISREWRKRLD